MVEKNDKPVIVISGMPGCGSTTAGKLLSEKLGIKFFSVGHYFKSLGHKGRETERAVNLWKSDTGREVQFSKKGSHNALEEMQIALAKSGDIVIESKLGIRFLKKYADFTVWLKAPLHTRAERYAKRDNIPVSEAARLLKEKESLERKNFKKIYGFDFFSQEKEADIVIDTSHKTPERVVDEIIRDMKKPEKRSVSFVIRKGNKILTIRRPHDDKELPNMWGLPATIVKKNESDEKAVIRAGNEKLGIRIRPLRLLNEGKQIRKDYALRMKLFEVSARGEPDVNATKTITFTRYTDWKWAEPEILKKAANKGSLCCGLFLSLQ